MGKRLFWIFVLTIGVITTIAATYIQSESFARIAKDKIQAAVARDLGIELNFDHLRIGVLPPSVSLVNVDVKVQSRANPLGLATDTVLKAESLGFSFRMIQAFSRGIAVNKVFWSEGEISLAIPPSKSKKEAEKLSQLVHRPIHVELGDGFSISVRQLEVRNTKLDLSWRDEGGASRLQIEKVGYLAVTPTYSGTNLVVNLENVDFQSGKIHETLKAIRGSADASRNLISISSLDLQRKEAALHASGKLGGNIDTLDSSKADLDIILRSPLQELADFEKGLGSLRGDLLADMKVVGKITDPSVQGKLELTSLNYSLWSMNKIEATGSYGNGYLVLDSLTAAEGQGKIALDNKVEIPIPLKAEPANLQLRMTGARYEDFAGDVKKQVNNLKFMMDGTVGLRVDFAQEKGKVKFAGLGIKPALTVKNFELNNQAFNQKRAYRQIFKVEPMKIDGNLALKNGYLSILDAKIALSTGSLAVTGGVGGAKGFDITGTTEAIDIGKEVGAISGSALLGQGSATVHVHGPNTAVLIDFTVKQKNVVFGKFDFGNAEGTVTYDDENNQILLTGIKGQKGTANYTAEGRVDVGEEDKIELEANFGESDPNDIFAIFKEQLKAVTWIPYGMTGLITGHAKVGGGYNKGLSSLKIDANVDGKNLNYKGEMLHELSVTAALDKAVLKAKINRARKYETAIAGQIEYNLDNDVMKYSLSAPKGKLRSLDFLTSTGFPIDGLFSASSEGEGKWETLVSKSRFEISSGYMRSRTIPNLLITYDTAADKSDLHVTAGPQVDFKARISNLPRGTSTASLKIADANFDYMLCAFSRRNCTDPDLAFTYSANGQFSWLGSDWIHLSGNGKVDAFDLVKSGYEAKITAPTTFTVNNGEIETQRFHLEGEDTKLNLKFGGKADGSVVSAKIDGQSSLRLLEFVNPLIEEAKGRVDVNFTLNGSTNEAKYSGSAALVNGFLRMSGLDAPVDTLNGKLRFEDSRITLENVNGQLGGGPAQVNGAVDIYLNRPPRFDLELILANNRIKFFPVSYAEVADGKLTFAGDKPPYLLGGSVKMKRVVMRNDFDLGGQKGLQNARYLPEKVAGAKSFYEIRIRANADGGISVENNLLDAEFRGEVTLLNTFEFPQILARAELVRGKLLFRSTPFTLDHAYIRAPNPEFFNPQFSVGGTATVDTYRISIFASGTVDKPKITLSSSPALSQEDIVSLLAFGYKGEDARRINPNDTSAITYSEVGSILLDQLKLNQNLQSKGIKVTVSPSFGNGEANIIRRDANTQAAPKVSLQTQILKNLDATFGGTLGSNQAQALDAKLEYRLSRKAAIGAVYEKIPTGLDATETRESYGGDLKFRWGFK
jgi:hypothetical protein